MPCDVVEGLPDRLPDRPADGVWWQDGGEMRCLVSSDGEPIGDAIPARSMAAACTTAMGLPPDSRDRAVGEAARALLISETGAFRMLERRGVELGPVGRADVVTEFTDAAVTGRAPRFPRIEIVESVVERCADASGASRWRATLLAEYPIGLLRGDAAHARWEQRRAARELAVRARSVNQLLDAGRWLDAWLEARRSNGLLGRVAPEERLDDEGLPREPLSELAAFTEVRIRVLAAEGDGPPIVVARGGRERARFVVEYPHRGAWIPAIGVPVRFSGGGPFRLAPLAPETDGAGVVAVDVVADGDPGEGTFMAYVDLPRPDRGAPGGEPVDVPDRAPGEASVDVPAVESVDVPGRAPGEASVDAPAEAEAGVRCEVVVTSAMDAAVCVEIDAGRAGDAGGEIADGPAWLRERVREGIQNGLDDVGSRLVECGPTVELVVAVDVSVATTRAGEAWSTLVTCRVVAIDQRLGERVGEVSFEVEEGIDGDAREVEALALREAGRLVAVYLEPRLSER